MNFEKKINNELKHETGFPGRPKKNLFFGSLPNVVGFPGLMAILSKKCLFYFFLELFLLCHIFLLIFHQK